MLLLEHYLLRQQPGPVPSTKPTYYDLFNPIKAPPFDDCPLDGSPWRVHRVT